MNVNNVVRTITIRGTSEGIDELTSKLGKLAGAQENVAVVSETSARRVLSLEDAWKKQSLKLDEAARSQANIARETKIADGALREGLITQQQHAERLNLISQRYATAGAATQKFAGQTGLARHELINLGRQGADVFTQLASGQSLFLTAAQQGPQVLDVLATSQTRFVDVVKSGVGWLGRFATSAAGVATGALAIGAGALYAASSWAEGQREIDKALIGIGRRSGVTANDINQIARSSASATGLSVDEARTAALEFVKTGAIFKDNIKAATDVTRNFAIVTGQDAKDAAQELAKSLASPLEGADALNTKLGFLDGRTREYIATLVSQNQKQEAQAVLLRNLAPAIQEATNTLGPFERAWNAVASARSNAMNAIGAALTPRTDEQRRDALVEQINRSVAAGAPPGVAAQGNFLEPGFNARGTVGQFDSPQIKRQREEVEALNETLRETARARALAFSGEVKISSDADEAVRALLPYIDQLKKVEEQLNRIKAAQENSGATDRQGLAGSNDAAARAGQFLAISIKNAAEETDRANAKALELLKTYNTSSREIANMRAGLADQLVAATAVGGQARMAAQEQATYNDLIRQGKTAQDAAGVAAAQRAVTQAQINTQAKEQVFNLQNQFAVVSSVTGAERMRAEAAATYNQLVHDGVDAGVAAGVASQQQANSQAQVNAQAQATLRSMQNQREVSEAITGDERISAQARATYNTLVQQGVNSSIASATAAEQEKQARAQATAAVYNQVHALDQQTSLVLARLNGTEATVKAEQAYENALRSGANEASAAAAKEATLRNERAKAYVKEIEQQRQANDSIKDKIYNIGKELDLLNAASAEDAARIKSVHAYNDAIRAGADGWHAQAVEAATLTLELAKADKAARDLARSTAVAAAKAAASAAGGNTSQAGPNGYPSVVDMPAGVFANQTYGTGGFEAQPGQYGPWSGRIIPNAQGYEYEVNKLLSGGFEPGSITGAIDKLLNRSSFALGGFGDRGLDSALAQTLSRLTDLLPDDQKASVIDRELAMLRDMPETIARDELIKQLTDQLKQLHDATEKNTDALNAQLDPLFSQGHDYLNSLRIGYYKAASGFDAVARGGIPGVDSIPFHAMVQEGERVTITPRGGMSPNTGSVANDNSRNVNVTQNITVNEAGPVNNLTARQMAQGFAQAAIRAAG